MSGGSHRQPRRDEHGQSYDPDTGQPICGSRKSKHDPSAGWCYAPAGRGTDHPGHLQCKMHMGCTPVVEAKGARAMVRAMGEAQKTDPEDAILATIATTAGHFKWLEEKVGGFRFVEQTKLDEDGVETEQFMTPNQALWWKLYGEERDRLVDYARIALKANVAERKVRLAEEQGPRLAAAVQRILDGLQLLDWQLALVPGVVPAALREIAPIIIEGEVEK